MKTPEGKQIYYSYDGYGRQKRRETPDNGQVNMKYNNDNSIRFSQDNSQMHRDQVRPSRYFTFRGYDGLNRMVYSGEIHDLTGVPGFDNLDPMQHYSFENYNEHPDNFLQVNVYDTLSYQSAGIFTPPSDYYDKANNTRGRLIATACRTLYTDGWSFKYYRYDARGRMTRMWLVTDGFGQKTFDYEYNSQSGVTQMTYQTGSGNTDYRRFYFGYDLAGRLNAIYECGGLQYMNIWGAGLEAKVKKDVNGNTIFSYYYKDHLGSITAVMDGASGTITQEQDYDAWGDICRTYSTTDTTVNKFTGKERDQETGYDYFGARYYDSRIGRWLQTEPLYDKYLQYSPYCYGLNNTEIISDINGKEVIIHGSQAEEILNCLQTQMPHLNLKFDNGKLIYSGKSKNEREQKLIDAINSDIKVNLFSSDENYYIDENKEIRSIIIGAYGGSEYDKEGVLNANQFINIEHAKISEDVGGWTVSEIILHEILEAYIGAINYPNKTYSEDIFSKVHDMINELSPKQKDLLKNIKGSDNNGTTFNGIQGPNGAYWLYHFKDKKYENYYRKLSDSELKQLKEK